ncbi:hypothetical protein [Streptomyces sp. CT34]|uniref:hypothetical protein n=1 Tax=Streptomyces sp. CT34 TaxID=1553907 RepID=UPI0005BD4539|nr:hypothetical protein [Streptomyces sp. CT34]
MLDGVQGPSRRPFQKQLAGQERTVRRSPGQHSPEIDRRICFAAFTARTIRAFNLPWEDRCEDYGRVAGYRGTLPGITERLFQRADASPYAWLAEPLRPLLPGACRLPDEGRSTGFFSDLPTFDHVVSGRGPVALRLRAVPDLAHTRRTSVCIQHPVAQATAIASAPIEVSVELPARYHPLGPFPAALVRLGICHEKY